ncbi:hypothetical protein DL96DRAFT_1589033 [Flagelloscypha sp. PMI_526]|nr:hypothetical protein DL96DRAFT_1589033 [Flagelloscypha sp. PMI_526]
MDEHIPYPSTPAFGTSLPSPAVFLGTVKLHGSNVTLVCRPRRPVQVQSRNHMEGAYRFFHSRPIDILVEKILQIRGGGLDYNEIIIAGEYAGGKIQHGVALNKLPIFYAIFNIRIDGEWVGDMREYRDVELPNHNIFNLAKTGGLFEVTIPDLGDKAQRQIALQQMEEYTRQVADECPFALQVSPTLLGEDRVIRGGGEGIVWTLVSPSRSPNLWNFKTKADKFLTTTRVPKVRGEDDQEVGNQIQAFVDFACPKDGRRLEQGLEYVREMHGEVDIKWTGEFIKWVIEDTWNEEGWRVGSEEEFEKATEKAVKSAVSRRAVQWYKDYINMM